MKQFIEKHDEKVIGAWILILNAQVEGKAFSRRSRPSLTHLTARTRPSVHSFHSVHTPLTSD
jgi:hypothetical protein